jgi:hypothetical protein
VRKEENRHGNTFNRFRWNCKFEYVFTERYASDEFELRHSILKTQVDCLKAGVPVEGIVVESTDAPTPAKPKTFRWLCESSEVRSRPRLGIERPAISPRPELCCRTHLPQSAETLLIIRWRAMRRSDLEILRIGWHPGRATGAVAWGDYAASATLRTAVVWAAAGHGARHCRPP